MTNLEAMYKEVNSYNIISLGILLIYVKNKVIAF